MRVLWLSMAASRIVVLSAASIVLSARGGLVAKFLNRYQGYTGPFNVQGITVGGQDRYSMVNLWYDLEGADPACFGASNGKANSCGIHIHRGLCSAPPAGHFYDVEMILDPWATVTYKQDGQTCGATNVIVNSQMSLAMHVGASVVVHDVLGTRIACGNLEGDMNSAGASAVNADRFGKYAGYMGTLVVRGSVAIHQVTSIRDSRRPAAVMEYSLEGVDERCLTSVTRALANSCGIHVHSGPCSDAGGHFFSTGQSDPWSQVVYFADDVGRTGTSVSVQIQVGETTASMIGRSLVVHDFSGARVACAPITAEPAAASPKILNGAPATARRGAAVAMALAASSCATRCVA